MRSYTCVWLESQLKWEIYFVDSVNFIRICNMDSVGIVAGKL